MAEDEDDFRWTIKLDWLNILSMLKLKNINQITEFKKGKAIRRLTRMYGSDQLMEFEPEQLESLIASELKESMKKELALNERKQKELERNMRNKIIPFKQGGIIKLDPRDFKDFNGNPEDLLKYLFKKYIGDDKDDDKDDDSDKYTEDRNHYYI